MVLGILLNFDTGSFRQNIFGQLTSLSMLIRNKAQCRLDHKWTFSYAPNVTYIEIRYGEFCCTQSGNSDFQSYSQTVNRQNRPQILLNLGMSFRG